MITVHIITSHFPPDVGGLQRWTADLAGALLRDGLRPVAYVCELPPVASFRADTPFEIVDIAPLAASWLAPLAGITPRRLARERTRVTFACLCAEMGKRLGAGANIVLSNFLTTAGFTAHLVAEALALPHVAVIAGTDFNRGLHNGDERHILLEVCGAARMVVGKSDEQVREIARHLPDTRCTVIETSVDPPERRWDHPCGETIRIFSDGGFSFKKGTGILIEAWLALRASGVPARLEICGGDQALEARHWATVRESLAGQSADADFPGQVPPEDVLERLYASDIYASATLGEGASAARARALCIGMPMLTTACGELAGESPAAHVRLVQVADAGAFREALRQIVDDRRAGRLVIDHAAVDRLRARFDPGIEWPRWSALLREVANG